MLQTQDLNYLGRDPAKVILVDTNTARFMLQPENGIAIKPWHGGRNDTGLIDLIPFLEAVALFNVPDVRPVLRKYGSTETVENFTAEQNRYRMEHLRRWEEEEAKRKKDHPYSGSFSIGSWLGLSTPVNTPFHI